MSGDWSAITLEIAESRWFCTSRRQLPRVVTTTSLCRLSLLLRRQNKTEWQFRMLPTELLNRLFTSGLFFIARYTFRSGLCPFLDNFIAHSQRKITLPGKYSSRHPQNRPAGPYSNWKYDYNTCLWSVVRCSLHGSSQFYFNKLNFNFYCVVYEDSSLATR